MDELKILVISGRIRKDSYTRIMANRITEVLRQKGAHAFHWDQLEKPLPIMVPELRSDVANHPDLNVREFAQMATDAGAFVFASPIYHNSYSGVLKNAIDHLRNPHFSYKPVGLVSFGEDRNKQAVDHLRIVARAVNAIAIPTNVCLDEEDFDGQNIIGEKILERIDKFADELILFAKTMKLLHENKIAKDK